VNAPPVTYEVNGVQYLTVAAGGNGLFGFPTGDEIVTWRLPDGAGRWQLALRWRVGQPLAGAR